MENKKYILSHMLSEYLKCSTGLFLFGNKKTHKLELEQAFVNPKILDLAADLILNKIDSSASSIIMLNNSRELCALGHAISIKTLKEDNPLYVYHFDNIKNIKSNVDNKKYCLFLLTEMTTIEQIKMAQLWCKEYECVPLQIILLLDKETTLQNKIKEIVLRDIKIEISSILYMQEIEKFYKKESND